MKSTYLIALASLVPTLLVACGGSHSVNAADDLRLNDAQAERLVRASYRFVAMYNVNNKFALKQGGWNTVDADTELKDHTMREIARPNNDTLYIGCLLDLRGAPIVLEMPAFGSDYASLMITGYDHYVNVPLSTVFGDFDEPTRMLVHSTGSQDYDGSPVEGVDRTFAADCDFVSAVFRIMPHASQPDRFRRIVEQMQSVRILTLPEYLGGDPPPLEDPGAPNVGQTDFDVFEDDLAGVMQFVFDHTVLDPADPIDRAVLDVWEPLGVAPGRQFAPSSVASLDGARLRRIAERIAAEELARSNDPQFKEQALRKMFLPKGQSTPEVLLFQSVIGPIGLPASQAVYPAVATADGAPMNAKHDYVLRMSADDLPPARAFWSLTLYDMQNGFFIPNERKKYSVGLNGGMKLDADGGIEVHVAAERPEGVPEENWLPIVRRDEEIGLILRIYDPDLEALEEWNEPVAERR